MQRKPGLVVLYQPPRPLYPLYPPALLPLLPVLPDPFIHALLVSPLPIALLRSLAHPLCPLALASQRRTVQSRPTVARAVHPSSRFPLARARHAHGVPKLVAGGEYATAAAGGRGHVVLAGDTGRRVGCQGGRGGPGQGVGGCDGFTSSTGGAGYE
jgi:hypothetical protein